LQPFAVESHSIRQHAQKLTGNTKHEQILNIVIKYFFVWQLVRELLISINTGDIFKAVMTEEKFAKSVRYTID